MTFLDFIALLIVAGLCGAIAQAITGFDRGGCLLSIGVGFIGAFIGSLLARGLDLPELFVFRAGEVQFPIVWSIIGAGLFILIVNLIRPRRSRH